MSTITLKCPACQFAKDIEVRKIPETTKRVTCPKCQHVFQYVPTKSMGAEKQLSQNMEFTYTELNTPSRGEPEGNLRKPKNLLLAFLFLLLFIPLVVGRLYFSNVALNIPSPNFITASEHGVATQWANKVLITDHTGDLIDQITLPEGLTPTQMIWVEDDLWVADYHTHRILVIDEDGQHWQPLNGGKIKGHFKVAPDLSNNRIFVSAGHSIQVYDLHGEFLSSFGKEGRSPGELKFPNQFLLDQDGNLLISNTKSPAIDKFAPDGTFLTRVVTPTGHPNYKYPTNVILLPDRIVTLEADGYLQDARIALYDRKGKYLGQHERIREFKFIGDIAAWEDRILATDLENARVYAFSAEDLRLLGDYSDELKQLGKDYQGNYEHSTWLARLCLTGLLVLLVPVVIFYARFCIRRARKRKAQVVDSSVVVQTLSVAKNDVLKKVDLNHLGSFNFIAVETHVVVDVVSIACLVVAMMAMVWMELSATSEAMPIALTVMTLSLLIGIILSLRSSWGCPVSLKKAKKLLEKLVKNKGLEVMTGVQQVGIGFCVDKSSLLLLMAPQQLLVAEFNLFGQLRCLSKLSYEGVSVDDQQYVTPAIRLVYGEKKKTLHAMDRKFLVRLKTALEDYLHAHHATDAPKAHGNQVAITSTKSKKTSHPVAALLSSLFPGLGQFYKRQIIRGAAIMVSFTTLMFGVAVSFEGIVDQSIDWTPVSVAGTTLTLFLGLVMYVCSIWDALRAEK